MYLGIRIYSRTAKNGSFRVINIHCSLKIIFLSMWMSKSGLFYSVGIQIAPVKGMVGLIGLEPMTPALSRRCSNQLSYRPVWIP